MHNFKRNSPQSRRSMDGFVGNAPGRQQQSGDAWPSKRQAQANSVSSGDIGDFKRPEGFHPTDRTQGTIGMSAPKKKDSKQADKKPEGSLLHMTLPGGSLNRKEDRKLLKNKKQGKWHQIRKWSLRGSLVLAGLIVVIGGFLAFKGYLNLNKVFKGGGSAAALQDDVTPDQLRGEGDGRVNVLLLGRGGEGHDGADLTDTILVASIDPVNKSAGLVSIPRDLWVTSGGQSSKINAVFANAKNKALRSDKDKAKAEAAGVDALKKTVTDTLGLPIHYYTMVDFAGFKQAVDVVGGVDINVPEDLAVKEQLWDETTGKNYLLNVPAGQQHFDSTKALFFTRSRKTSAHGDFDRAERQRLFITALSQKILSAGTYTNPVKVSQLMDAFGSHVSTDFSVSDAVRLMQIGKEIQGSSIASIGLSDQPNPLVKTDNINGQSVVVPIAGVSNFGPIQAFIRSKLPDGFIIKEGAKLQVLNGTTMEGLATKKGDELKSYSYNVVVVGDAPTKTYDKTIIVDLTNNKPYTKNYLEKRFKTTAVSKLPDDTIQAQGADFVIILGSNDR